VCRSLGEPASCLVEGSGSELVVVGDVLTDTRSYRGGEVVVRADGTIACAGCECPKPSDARRVTCPGSIIAPAFVNPHDHVAYSHEPPRPGGTQRYEHRHD
jgi:cytosine/adenosine deaminase-related metal-dependent hydrolase